LTEIEAAASGGAPAKQGHCVLDHRGLARDARRPIRVRDPDFSAEFIELLVYAS
jgi:hypothetical protein